MIVFAQDSLLTDGPLRLLFSSLDSCDIFRWFFFSCHWFSLLSDVPWLRQIYGCEVACLVSGLLIKVLVHDMQLVSHGLNRKCVFSSCVDIFIIEIVS